MQIIEKTYSFGTMDKRKQTTRIILHHAAAVTCTADDIHRWHKDRGWAGIGYHFFIRKDGSIYRGRPQNTVGAHAGGSNSDSVGVCFEGNYETETTMPDAQKKAGIELVAYLKDYYGITRVEGHRDVGATACPGKNFPFAEIVNGVAEDMLCNCVYGGEIFVLDLQKLLDVETVQGKDLPQLSMTKNRSHLLVKAVQVRLFALGYNFPKYGADGDFGAETDAAVKAFQKKRNLNADGIVGVNTWNALMQD